MSPSLLGVLENLAILGESHDAREPARGRRLLNITRDTGRLLWLLVRATGAREILEVGTSNAFSTIWLADAARSTGGRVTTLEVDPAKIALARSNLAAAGVADLVEVVEGRAARILPTLPAVFDVVFLDADRHNYLTYLEFVVPKLRAGGLLIADNATSHPEELVEYLEGVNSHPELFSVTVPIGNGEAIAVKVSST